jgi:hypothetical protein
MLMRDIFTIFVLLASIIIVLVLFRTPTTIQNKQRSSVKVQIVDAKYVPRVYEVMYVKRDPKDIDVWMFAKNNKGTTARFVEDVNNNGINHALIYGRLYETKYVMDDGAFYYVKVTDKCSTSKGFFNCTTNVPTSDNVVTMLHVLGYNFA